MPSDPKSCSEPGRTEQPAGDLAAAGAVKRSSSGQLSVSIDAVSKTDSFQRNLQTLARIRELVQAGPVGR